MIHWILAFRAEGAGPPLEIRVRRLLKNALRFHKLRCSGHWTTETLRPPHQVERFDAGLTAGALDAPNAAESQPRGITGSATVEVTGDMP